VQLIQGSVTRQLRIKDWKLLCGINGLLDYEVLCHSDWRALGKPWIIVGMASLRTQIQITPFEYELTTMLRRMISITFNHSTGADSPVKCLLHSVWKAGISLTESRPGVQSWFSVGFPREWRYSIQQIRHNQTRWLSSDIVLDFSSCGTMLWKQWLTFFVVFLSMSM
jgi:hypothetical protein